MGFRISERTKIANALIVAGFKATKILGEPSLS
jgi:hypothetical protein